MKKHNFILTAILAVLFFGLSAVSYAQPEPPDGGPGKGGPKSKEKILQFKKIRLLEILNLDEATADKFIAKYTVIEKRLMEQKQKLDDEVDKLNEKLKSGSKDDCTALTNKIIQMQEDLAKEAIESMKSMKSILNENDYAKYVAFESKFKEEFQKMIFRKMKERGKDKRDRDRDDD